jgi:coenzyme F420-reducing hydrogenase beta subunit
MCENVCPILNYSTTLTNENKMAAIVQHKNSKICSQSTAGGAFSAIAEYIIEQGGVVFGVELQADYSVRHIYIDKKEELQKFRNSKYVQSNIGNIYQQVKKFLDMDKLVCFSGTPCQIEGLLRYLQKDYENLILVDVVCRAVPSPGVWKKYMDMVNKKYGFIKSVRFRDKTLGYQYSTMVMIDNKGNEYRGGVESQIWLRMFFSGMIIRPSCTDCKFRSANRKSDFTIWDCFNVYQIDRGFDENCGTTRVLIHTVKGKNIFEKIKEKLKYKIIPVEIAVKGVKEMSTSPVENSRKAEFFKDMKIMSMESLMDKYFHETFKVKFKRFARLMLNRFGLDIRLKHILKKR